MIKDYQYGIGLAKETVIRLNNGKNLDEKLHRAWNEIDVMTLEDVTPEWYESVKDWKKRYLELNKETASNQSKQDLVNELLFICGGIINTNEKPIPDEE